MAELVEKAEWIVPKVGDIAVMRYEKSGLDHVGKIEATYDSGFLMSETNYKPGEFTYRFIPYDYPHLIGFYPI